jgi:hypothetical protein
MIATGTTSTITTTINTAPSICLLSQSRAPALQRRSAKPPTPRGRYRTGSE